MHKGDVSEIDCSSTFDVCVYDDNGEPCTEGEYMRNHEDEAYIIINRPLSYAIACNIFDTDEAREDEEFKELVSQSEEKVECDVAYAAGEDPEELILLNSPIIQNGYFLGAHCKLVIVS